MARNKRKFRDYISDYSFIRISRPMLEQIGDWNIVAMLQALVEADVLCADNEGWFYQTSEIIEEKYKLTRRKQDSAIQYLIDNNLVEKRVMGSPPKRYFKLNDDKLISITHEKCAELIKKSKRKSRENVQNDLYKTDKSICTETPNQNVQKRQNDLADSYKTYINKEISNKEISNKDKAQSQAIDEPTQKKRNTVDWDWTDRIVERFGVTEQVAKDFITARKSKRAPITETVLSHFQSEVKKVNDAGVYFAEREAFAYWVASGWQGFKADWYLKGQQVQCKTGYQKKETIEECMARLSTSKNAMEELDVTPSKNGLVLPVFDDFDSDDPFAYYQKNNT